MITPADLLAPAGPVEDTMFPGEGDGVVGTDLYERLQTYIDRAFEVVDAVDFDDPDPATRVYALYLTFDGAYMVAVARPSSENSLVPVIGSEAYSKDQRDALKARSLDYLEQYNVLVSQIPVDEVQVVTPIRSRTITHTFDY